MNKLDWQDLLTVFKSTGLSDHSYLHFFDEYNFLKLNEHNDVVVLTSESWRADYSPMLLDYCMKQNIEFDTVNSHTMWMNPTAFLVNRAIDSRLGSCCIRAVFVRQLWSYTAYKNSTESE